MINSFRDDYSFLSNFFMRDTMINGVVFKSNEHYFVYCKLFHLTDRQTLLTLPSPAEAKRFGRNCPIMPDWADRRVGVMAYGLYHKFVMHADLRLMLIDTGIEELVEGNYWHDNFWGDCGCPKCASIKGKNVLGRLLMNTRNYFRELTSIVLE